MRRRNFFAFLGVAPIVMVMAPKAAFSALVERDRDQMFRDMFRNILALGRPRMEDFDIARMVEDEKWVTWKDGRGYHGQVVKGWRGSGGRFYTQAGPWQSVHD